LNSPQISDKHFPSTLAASDENTDTSNGGIALMATDEPHAATGVTARIKYGVFPKSATPLSLKA
jgi:hypothetical protein